MLFVVAYALGVVSKRSLPRPIARNFIPMFSSRSFISHPTFKSLILGSGMSYSSIFILLHVNI